MQNPLEIYVDDETKLTLHGLQQFYVKLSEAEKNRKLNELLDNLEFNQVIIFVKSTLRATELDKLLRECNFPSIAVTVLFVNFRFISHIGISFCEVEMQIFLRLESLSTS